MTIATTLTPCDLDAIAALAKSDLAPIARKIDEERVYPEAVLRAMGGAGAYGTHIGGTDAAVDLGPAILSMAKASETCLSTGFCMWCQDALAWYIASSDNDWLKTNLLPGIAKGEILGGTGMSNPMKSIAEIEPLRLKGTRVEGGYSVKGLLPWVSNLSEGGYFGVMFGVEGDGGPRTVMAIAHADAGKGVKLKLDHDFVAMGGTATVNVQFRDVFIPDEYVIGDPAPAFIKRIRAGFVLLQCGMAAGMIRSAIDQMEQVKGPLGHVNQYLERQPEDIEAEYDALVAEVLALARTPYDDTDALWKRVLQARLKGGELAVEAAHYAMLHCGARGYVSQGAAQRRLREAYFVAIVTPATKHLRKMIAAL
ncbi:acyl-CoA dehydrogenase family protein [Mesobacterium pallidum]|uniref:acyl-CoA dehydrogenase family protein n=1 Tax=Mesobacterium pallidum TaxID=2872037 RepID=UPI001EE156D9|nr:acyl-CoA dehydrogenase family protein [Mesobacterium pallidum]